MKKISLLAFIVLLSIVGVITVFLYRNQQKIATISNFEECAAAGYEIMESYPARCMTPDKRSFTQDLPAGRQVIPNPTESQTGFTCGNGICENITCDAIGCPDAESPASCPFDCPYDR
jgi:hypothetical protein